MNILLEEDGRLRVDMSAQDLARYGLDYRRLDYSNQKTRYMLRGVLEATSRLTGFVNEVERMLIEVFPAPAGGCTVFFSGASELSTASLRTKRYKKELSVFDFEDSDRLLGALELLYAQKEAAQGDLYELSGKYRLVIRGGLSSGQSEAILREYSSPVARGRLAEAYIREHGRLLASGRPVSDIGKLMSGGR